MDTLKKSWGSIGYFVTLIFSGSLHMSKRHLGNRYTARDSKTYAVFLETISDKEYNEKEVTLIVGFRLRLIGNNAFFHWLFQRVCVLDTPIWVGFKGFKIKYWMVAPRSNDYLGLYCYQGREHAKQYAEYICAVLRPLSTDGSVWYRIEDKGFDTYTRSHSANDAT